MRDSLTVEERYPVSLAAVVALCLCYSESAFQCFMQRGREKWKKSDRNCVRLCFREREREREKESGCVCASKRHRERVRDAQCLSLCVHVR